MLPWADPPPVNPNVFVAVVSPPGAALCITQIRSDRLCRPISQRSTTVVPFLAREKWFSCPVCSSAAGGGCSHASELIRKIINLPQLT